MNTVSFIKYANLAENLQPAMSEEDLVGALTSHYSFTIQRSLISGNIKTTQDAITLLGKSDALEAQGNYRNTRQDPETQEADRRTRYNQRGDMADRNWREAVRVQQIQYEDRNRDRNQAYGSPNRNARRGRYYSGWGSMKDRGVVIWQTAAAYRWIRQHKISNPGLTIYDWMNHNTNHLTVTLEMF